MGMSNESRWGPWGIICTEQNFTRVKPWDGRKSSFPRGVCAAGPGMESLKQVPALRTGANRRHVVGGDALSSVCACSAICPCARSAEQHLRTPLMSGSPVSTRNKEISHAKIIVVLCSIVASLLVNHRPAFFGTALEKSLRVVCDV